MCNHAKRIQYENEIDVSSISHGERLTPTGKRTVCWCIIPTSKVTICWCIIPTSKVTVCWCITPTSRVTVCWCITPTSRVTQRTDSINNMSTCTSVYNLPH
ncbi:hypothetical protein SLEP1_g18920 [Rubroshorea leprosula]|uniref:Uncharacterized protein n=1 Tax=Rubroshorea leprosula TaxID=152421 RepID=A0AAV5JAY3_9ROSI|nr:hypothetical protein SLEP1_g18920 [Rubroshorea leprosula]